jgi:hypothetical protein
VDESGSCARFKGLPRVAAPPQIGNEQSPSGFENGGSESEVPAALIVTLISSMFTLRSHLDDVGRHLLNAAIDQADTQSWSSGGFAGGAVSARRSNWPSHCTEWSCDGERSPDEGEAEVFRQLERPNGIHRLVVRHRRHQCDRVADKQRPPCPAITAAERGDAMARNPRGGPAAVAGSGRFRPVSPGWRHPHRVAA